ncbi:AprI/Inh family metalloprotease inhibitor [Candidatus Endowatersipora endosymbiont of Watersipora subatra]|uniref:AprI/Inh family metalloprotease inhibitor n=1 Tax=Candidatus Endowatersipora endosymbiont of Watersipora subatra TaxID=3077946 RepID=UPI00312CA178
MKRTITIQKGTFFVKSLSPLGILTAFSLLLVIGGCSGLSILGQDLLDKPIPPAPVSLEKIPDVDEDHVEPVHDDVSREIDGILANPNGSEKSHLIPRPGMEAPVSPVPMTYQSMVGAWTMTVSGSSCQIFLALTKWSGGYRAASRGCQSPSILDIQAWDIRDSQLILLDSNRLIVAALYKDSTLHFDGLTNIGNAISLSR